MNQDAASLDRMRDIFVPVPVSWWPLAPAWWVVGCACLMLLFVLLVRAILRWRRNAYRRAAVRAIASATSANEIAGLLKRTALAAFPRTDVASMSGTEWSDWLSLTSGLDIPAAVSHYLSSGAYDKNVQIEQSTLAEFAVAWVRIHRVERGGRPC